MQPPVYTDAPMYRDDPSKQEGLDIKEKGDPIIVWNSVEDVEDRSNRRRCGVFRRARRAYFGEPQSIWKRVAFVMLKVVLLVGLVGFFFKGKLHVPKKTCTHSKPHVLHTQGWPEHPGRPRPSLPRDIKVNKTTSSILGEYPLYDSLNLTTTTGSIAVIIEPQPGQPDEPDKPARVLLKTDSGSISVAFRLPGLAASSSVFGAAADIHSFYHDQADGDEDSTSTGYRTALAPRPYEIEIHTSSGSISGQLAFSNRVHISTISGSISANLVPLIFTYPGDDDDDDDDRDDDGDYNDRLPLSNISIITSTKTGSTQVSLAEPYFPPPPPPGGPRRSLNRHNSPGDNDKDGRGRKPNYPARPSITAKHIAAGTGSLHVTYPPSWAGRIHAASTGKGKGHVLVGGDGVLVRSTANETAVEGRRYPDEEERAEWWGATGEMNVTVASEGGQVNFWARG
ncbi:hypothetical protein FQN50_001266 [Emmonsiellopsis sp. PD_5]|nr:hypothetical protein FQN50_001266 [Emmonsiellopsis sp. PD_5]